MVIGQLCVPKSELEEGGWGFLQAIRPLQTALKGVGQGLLQPRLSIKPITRRTPMAGMTGPPSYNTCTGKNIQKIALVAFGRLNSWDFFFNCFVFPEFSTIACILFSTNRSPCSVYLSLPVWSPWNVCLSFKTRWWYHPLQESFHSSTAGCLSDIRLSLCLSLCLPPSPSSSHNTQGLWPAPRCPACPAWEEI